jgi:hypothetical protein
MVEYGYGRGISYPYFYSQWVETSVHTRTTCIKLYSYLDRLYGKSYSSPSGDGYKPSPTWFQLTGSFGLRPINGQGASRPRGFSGFVEFFLVFLGFWFCFGFLSIFPIFFYFFFFNKFKVKKILKLSKFQI